MARSAETRPSKNFLLPVPWHRHWGWRRSGRPWVVQHDVDGISVSQVACRPLQPLGRTLVSRVVKVLVLVPLRYVADEWRQTLVLNPTSGQRPQPPSPLSLRQAHLCSSSARLVVKTPATIALLTNRSLMLGGERAPDQVRHETIQLSLHETRRVICQASGAE